MNGVPLYGFGSSSELNFKVVSYADAAERSAAIPKENTLGVVTREPITAWVFASRAPEAPIPGTVHVSTAADSAAAFNALKHNELRVYPTGCSQFVDGAWTPRDAMFFQGGIWKNWSITIFSGGQVSAAAGELTQTGVPYGGSAGVCTLTRTEDAVKIGTFGGRGALVYFTGQMDLTHFKTLCFTGSVVDKSSASSVEKCGIGVWKEIPTANAGTEAAAILEGFRPQGTHNLDISGCSGLHYVGIAVHGFGEASKPYLEVTLTGMELK